MKYSELNHILISGIKSHLIGIFSFFSFSSDIEIYMMKLSPMSFRNESEEERESEEKSEMERELIEYEEDFECHLLRYSIFFSAPLE